MKELFLFGTIAFLFLGGVVIAIKSGDARGNAGSQSRLHFANAWALFLRLAGYLIGLMAVQRAVGLPSFLRW